MIPAAVLLWLPVLVPFSAATLLLRTPRPRVAERIGVAAAGAGLLACVVLLLVPRPAGAFAGALLKADALSLWLLLPAAAVGLAAVLPVALSARPEGADQAIDRLRPAALQALLGAHHLALLSDGPVPSWASGVAALGAAFPLLTSRTDPAGAERAWRTLLLCGAGLTLALFGSVLLVLALPPTTAASGWAAMAAAAPNARADVLGVGFVFLLVGYGALAGLAPLQAWVPGLLAGRGAAGVAVFVLLAGSALHPILRAQSVLQAAPDAVPVGDFMIALGFVSLGVALLAGLQRRGVRVRVACSGVGHAGLTFVSFGLNAPSSGLLHLSGSALLLAAASCGSERAVPAGNRSGWGATLALAGLAGLPPFALFASELGLATAAAREAAWLPLPLCLGLAALAAMLASVLAFPRRGRSLLAAPPATTDALVDRAVAAVPWLCLGAALLLGLATPSLLLEAAAAVQR